MADKVNGAITDAVTQSNVKVVGEAPAISLGTVYQSLAQATGVMFTNSVHAQGQQNVLGQAATTQGVMQIFSLDTISDAVAIARVLEAS